MTNKFAFSAALLSLVACSSGGGSSTGSNVDAGSLPPSQGSSTQNPYGVEYPGSHIGISPRGTVKSTTPGSRLQNFAFKGTLTGNPADMQTRITMAQFFDPESRDHKLIFIQAAGVWCSVCQTEARAITPKISELKAKGVMWMTAIIESKNSGEPATLVDLTTWYNKFKTPSPMVLDSGAESFGAFFTAAAMPWNAVIDARSMEILEAHVGSSNDVYGAVTKQANDWLDWQTKNAPLEP